MHLWVISLCSFSGVMRLCVKLGARMEFCDAMEKRIFKKNKLQSNCGKIVCFIELAIHQKHCQWHLRILLFSFPVTRLCASSYRAITYYQSSERTKHKMQGMLSIQHTWKETNIPTRTTTDTVLHILRTCSALFYLHLTALKLPDVP